MQAISGEKILKKNANRPERIETSLKNISKIQENSVIAPNILFPLSALEPSSKHKNINRGSKEKMYMGLKTDTDAASTSPE